MQTIVTITDRFTGNQVGRIQYTGIIVQNVDGTNRIPTINHKPVPYSAAFEPFSNSTASVNESVVNEIAASIAVRCVIGKTKEFEWVID